MLLYLARMQCVLSCYDPAKTAHYCRPHPPLPTPGDGPALPLCAASCPLWYVPWHAQMCTMTRRGVYHDTQRCVPCHAEVCTMTCWGLYTLCLDYYSVLPGALLSDGAVWRATAYCATSCTVLVQVLLIPLLWHRVSAECHLCRYCGTVLLPSSTCAATVASC